jgi:hypothetical protein
MAERLQRSKAAADTTQATTRTTTTTTASASVPPKDEKHDENIVVKTAHSIRDKVHGLTADVKEKAHKLTHSDQSKKK